MVGLQGAGPLEGRGVKRGFRAKEGEVGAQRPGDSSAPHMK